MRAKFVFAAALGFLGLAAASYSTDGQSPAATSSQLTLFRGSQALGASLFNRKGDHVGNIKNILFDENLGDMTHAVLSAGAYPGMGDRMSPVPWGDITVKRLPNGNTRFLAGSTKWNTQTETVGPKGVKIVRLNEVLDSKLFDRQGRELGKIKDVVMDGRTGAAIYAAIAFDQSDERLTMVPWKLIRQSKSAKPGYVLQIDPAKAHNAASFSPNEWPNLDDLNWNRKIYNHYGVQPYFWNGLR